MTAARQLALLDDPLDVAYVEWSRANPHVIDLLRRLALDWHAAGHRRCSIAMLVEVVRWQHGVATVDTDGTGLMINNSYRSRIARHLLATTPALPPDFFATRTLATDR